MRSFALLCLLSSFSTLFTPLVSAGPASNYPPADGRGPPPMAAWVTQYNLAKSQGRIPSTPPSTLVNGNPVYPPGTNGGPGSACSWTTSHCFGAYDVVDAPTGILGVSFDDGPQPASPALYAYLKSQNQRATHFMIGSRILDNPAIFRSAVANGGHVAVHTWSHPYMTTMTDMQILGELGWTSQIIFDNSGLIPAFWRPPYGDVDNRVRAIAKEVFGLLTVIWNQDTFDWCLSAGGGSSCVGAGPGTDAGLDAGLQAFYHGSKTPGLILLEHEVTMRSIDGFVRNFATAKSAGWTPKAIPDIWNVDYYLNAADSSSPIRPNIFVGQGSPAANGTAAAIPSTTVAPQSSTVRIATPTSTGVIVTAMTITRTTSDSATALAASTGIPSASPATSKKSTTSNASRISTLATTILAPLTLCASLSIFFA